MAAICPSTVAVQKDWALLARPLPPGRQPRGEAIPWQLPRARQSQASGTASSARLSKTAVRSRLRD